jgi:hypothetical protein
MHLFFFSFFYYESLLMHFLFELIEVRSSQAIELEQCINSFFFFFIVKVC